MKKIFSLPLIGIILVGLLASAAVQAQTLFSVEVKGKGQPIILIHGLSCTGAVWDEVVEHYKSNYELHVVTLAGFGGLAPQLTDNFLSAVKDDLVTYVKTKKLKKPVIMGHSLGGFVSFWAASKSPELFSAVVSVDGLPSLAAIIPGMTPEGITAMAANMKTAISNSTPDQTRTQMKAMLPSMMNDQTHLAKVLEMCVSSDAKTIGQSMYELYTIDLREEVATITCPVLLLGAWIAYKDYGSTHETTLQNLKAQTSKIANCSVEITDTAKHFIFYDDPTWFYGKVDGFLNKAVSKK